MNDFLPRARASGVRVSMQRASVSLLLAFGLVAGSAGQASAATLDRTVSFDIDAQPLEKALLAFSQQANIQVVLNMEPVAQAAAPALKGNVPARTGLDELLRNSGYRYAAIGERTVSVMRIAQSESAPAAEAAAADGDSLQEIIVTAQKRGELLSKTSVAVSALSQDQLQASGVASLKDLSTVVPNVEFKTIGLANTIQVSIRGITNSDYNQTGNPAVATYIDGVYVGNSAGLAGDLYDLARVEILRGPQGTLYGRNSTGGNINIITADPTEAFDSAVDASFGNYGDTQIRAMANIPVSSTLSIRGAFNVHRNDGYFKTQRTTARNYSAADDYAGRLTALWKPTDNFTWRLSADDLISNGTPSLAFVIGPDGKPADGLPIYSRPIEGTPEPSSRIKNLAFRSRMEWRFSDSMALSYIAGYQDVKYYTQYAVTPLIEDGIRDRSTDSSSHELNLSFDRGRLSNIFGMTYFESKTRPGDAYHLPTLGITFVPVAGTGMFNNEAWGVFDQATFRLTDRARLIGGVRYSSERAHLTPELDIFCPLDTPFPPQQAGIVLPGCDSVLTNDIKGTWSDVSWKTGLEFDWSDHTFSYVTVTTGFKSGGPNSGSPPADKLTFRPENITDYELGVKTRLLEGRASLSTALFYMDYSDLQVSQILGFATVTDNAATASIYGVEMEGQWRFTARDTVSGFANYMRATYGEYNNAVDDHLGNVIPSLKGNSLPFAPRVSMRLQYSHDFTLANGGVLRPMVAGYWQSRSYLRAFNFPIDRVDSFTKTDLSLTYDHPGDHWSATAYVYNLEDEAVRNGGFPDVGFYLSDYNPPRIFGARVSYEF